MPRGYKMLKLDSCPVCKDGYLERATSHQYRDFFQCDRCGLSVARENELSFPAKIASTLGGYKMYFGDYFIELGFQNNILCFCEKDSLHEFLTTPEKEIRYDNITPADWQPYNLAVISISTICYECPSCKLIYTRNKEVTTREAGGNFVNYGDKIIFGDYHLEHILTKQEIIKNLNNLEKSKFEKRKYILLSKYNTKLNGRSRTLEFDFEFLRSLPISNFCISDLENRLRYNSTITDMADEILKSQFKVGFHEF